MKPRTPAPKYHFMLGTTSRVPGAPGWHYLILDIDGGKKLPSMGLTFGIKPACIAQRTNSGWHVFTAVKMRLKPMLKRAIHMGADRTWARLALKRGWAFLADKGEVKIPWPVERMVIGWKGTQCKDHSNTNAKRKQMNAATKHSPL